MSASPSCWCAPDDHLGLVLHPLFPHAHGDDHAPASAPNGPAPERLPLVDQEPGISAATAGGGTYVAIAGLLLPLALAGPPLGSRRLRPAVTARPDEWAFTPPIPPPR